jgi:hypothetical protein
MNRAGRVVAGQYRLDFREFLFSQDEMLPDNAETVEITSLLEESFLLFLIIDPKWP